MCGTVGMWCHQYAKYLKRSTKEDRPQLLYSLTSTSNILEVPRITVSISTKGKNFKFLFLINYALCMMNCENIWGSGGMAPPFLTSALGKWSGWCSAHFYPGIRTPCTHCIVCWVGLRAGLNVVEKKSCPCRDSNFDHPARSRPLYRLSYHDSILLALLL
jgi:hypothetical protein